MGKFGNQAREATDRQHDCDLCMPHTATMFSVGDKLLTGTSSGCLQLWSVDCSSSPPAVTMETTMVVDGGVSSSAFDSKMELVCVLEECVLRGEGLDVL